MGEEGGTEKGRGEGGARSFLGILELRFLGGFAVLGLKGRGGRIGWFSAEWQFIEWRL